MHRRHFTAAGFSAFTFGIGQPASAQRYPSRPVHLIVPYPAGGGTDTLARPFAERLRARLGQPVVIENRGGASTRIGMEYVARSTPDGHTLILNADNVAIFPHLYTRLSFDLFRDFAPIGFIAAAPMVLGCNPRLPIRDVAELIAIARREPSRLKFANPSSGSPHHLAFELFCREAGIEVLKVDYRGGGPALNDVYAGHVDLGVFTLGVGMPHFDAGTLHPLAILSDRRTVIAPHIPTIVEAGLPNAQVVVRYMILAPAMTPRDVINTLHTAATETMADAGLAEQLPRSGYQVEVTTPEETTVGLRREHDRWRPILRAAKIHLE